MPNDSIRVLIVSGASDRAAEMDEVLTRAGLQSRVVSDSVSARGALAIWGPSVAVVDLRFPADEPRRFCADVTERPGADTLPLVLVAEGPNLLKPSAVIPAGLVASPIDPEHLVATVIRVDRDAVRARGEAVVSR